MSGHSKMQRTNPDAGTHSIDFCYVIVTAGCKVTGHQFEPTALQAPSSDGNKSDPVVRKVNVCFVAELCLLQSLNAATISASAETAIEDASRKDGTNPIGPRSRLNDVSPTCICRRVSLRIS